MELLQCPSDEIKLEIITDNKSLLKNCIQPRQLRIKDSGLTLLLSEKDLETVKLIRYAGSKHHIKLQTASQKVDPPQWLFSIP